MVAVNHALTGAAIGLLVGQPILAVPLAVASHYVCDVLPHFGLNLPDKIAIRSNIFRNYLVVDSMACMSLVLILFIVQPEHWFLASICAFMAAAPDFLSINRYLTIRAGKKWKPGIYTKFAGDIQWFERPIGAVVEVAWFIAGITVLLPFMVG